MKTFLFSLFLVLVPLLMIDAREDATDAPSDRKGEVFPFVWAGLKDNRERLRRGVFHARGRKIDDDPNWGRLDGEVAIFCAFDYDRELFRFDREYPERISKQPHIVFDKKSLDKKSKDVAKPVPRPTGNPKASWSLGTLGGKWVNCTFRENLTLMRPD